MLTVNTYARARVLPESQIDWVKLLDDIAWLIGEGDFAVPGARVPAGQIALSKYLGMSRGAVRNMLDGTEPRHSDGVRLLCVWVKLSGKPESFAPTCRAAAREPTERRVRDLDASHLPRWP